MAARPEKTSVTIEVPEHPAYLSVVRQAVASIAHVMGFDDVEILQLQMAVDEACNNVIEHGAGACRSGDAGAARPGSIRLKFNASPEKLVMQVQDRCSRFSPLERELPDLEQYFRSPTNRGLGLVILRKFVDEVHHSYRSDLGNTLSLTKYLPKGKDEAEGRGRKAEG